MSVQTVGLFSRSQQRISVVVTLFAAVAIVAFTPRLDAQAPLTQAEVSTLLTRASMATTSQDAIIAVVDRSGRILGVRCESQVLANFAGRPNELCFAIDGAVAKARTAASFSASSPTFVGSQPTFPFPHGLAPLTSRTVRFISQSTVTQREVESNPNDPVFASTKRGPGLVAPIGVAGRFPPQVTNTPLVDLFAIEHQGRDSKNPPGLDGMKGTTDDTGANEISLGTRFDVNLAHVPVGAQAFMQTFPESYGSQSGVFPNSQSRGFGTLPGGIGIFKNAKLVGGIGVFFPGLDGFASFEQGFKHTLSNGGVTQTELSRLNAPKVLEAEFIAFFAAGGTTFGMLPLTPVTEFERSTIPKLPGFGLPNGRIDLVGIMLEVYGPTPTRENPLTGPQRLLAVGRASGGGNGANSGANQIVAPGNFTLAGVDPPEGWLVNPHASSVDPISAADVTRIVNQGIAEAGLIRAAIRLDVLGANNVRPGAKTRMVLAVADSAGEVLGLFRMPDATIFSIDVAVAKARNTAYYAGSTLQNPDRVDQDNNSVFDVPLGTAFTNRTFRFLAGPFFPTGAASGLPGDFSILNVPGIDRGTAENVNNVALPASVFNSPTTPVVAFDSFNVGRNFRAPTDLKRQNGVVFFPGSSPIYRASDKKLLGGFGVSGDGVDQDDVVTVAGQVGFAAPAAIRADQYIVSGVRLPFQKFNRNPQGQ